MSDRFEKRMLNGEEVMNPYRNECSSEYKIETLRHEQKEVIHCLLWAEDENKKLKAEIERANTEWNSMLTFALSLDSCEVKDFLSMWNEGCFPEIEQYWPEWKAQSEGVEG